MSRLWVMNNTAGTAAGPWFQLVVPKTVVKSWWIPCKKLAAPLVGGGWRRRRAEFPPETALGAF